MKYKGFFEWFKQSKHRRVAGILTQDMMLDAWDAAVNNNPENEQNAAIGEKITELLNTINDVKKIDCTCDKVAIAGGKPCICVRGAANQQAGIALGTYLRELRKELK